jgi:glutamate transport system substrate-binding protein
MTSRRWIVAALVALSLLAAGCGKDSSKKKGASSTATTIATFPPGTPLDAIQKRGKLIVGTKFDQPLFGVKNPTTGDIEGFDAEIARLMAKAIFGDPAKIEFIEAVSKNREPFLQEGKVDIVVATYTINDKRKQVVDFAGPYYVARQDILVKKDDNTIKAVQDLNGKKVCTVQGSTSLTNLQAQAPQADVSTLFDKYGLCVEALNDGRVQAVTTDNAILAGFVEQGPDKYKLVGAPFSNEPYGIGLKKGDNTLQAFLNTQLEMFFRDGQWKKAYDKTLGKVIPGGTPPAIVRY